MGYKEYNINSGYNLFAQVYFEVGGSTTLNPFLATHRAAMAAPSANAQMSHYLDLFQKIDNLNILAAQPNGDKLMPLNAQLVLPTDQGDGPFPLAVLIHGNARSFYPSDAPTREVPSYRGYRYLQKYLAERGVASVSVNVNLINFWGSGGHPDLEYQYRLQLAFLVMGMLAQVGGSPVTTGQLIFLKKTDDSIAPLHEALELEGSFSSRSPEGRLRILKTAIEGKIDFTKLGFMGHSRGGTAVQFMQPFFGPRTGTAPTDYTGIINSTFSNLSRVSGPYNSNPLISHNSGNTVQTSAHLFHRNKDCIELFGDPGASAIKTIVALQPEKKLTLLNSLTTFFLVIASSHDGDVQEDAFNSYDDVNAPKAMIYSHGASHGRFNSVWRRLDYVRRDINRDIMGQSPIRMLSNRGHEELGKATMGNTFLAALKGEDHRFGLYTGEVRASLRQDIERAWKFPFPFTDPPKMRVLDGNAITATDITTSTAVTIRSVTKLHNELVNSNNIYANDVGVKAFTRPAANPLLIRIPVTSADKMVTRTHFSFRYTKLYDARSSSARRSVNFRNYTLQLKAGTNVVGVAIPGSAVSSLHHPAYPVRQFTYDIPGGGYYDDTVVLLQTAEVPLSQFLTNGQPTTDLSQVDKIEIKLEPLSGGSGDETFFFVDFILVTRNLPAAPADFEIP